MAASTASEPLLQKKDAPRSPGVSSASLRASSTVTALVVPYGLVYGRRRACSYIACAISSRP